MRVSDLILIETASYTTKNREYSYRRTENLAPIEKKGLSLLTRPAIMIDVEAPPPTTVHEKDAFYKKAVIKVIKARGEEAPKGANALLQGFYKENSDGSATFPFNYCSLNLEN